MSVDLPTGASAWVFRYQLPPDGLVCAGSNILVVLCFLGRSPDEGELTYEKELEPSNQASIVWVHMSYM